MKRSNISKLQIEHGVYAGRSPHRRLHRQLCRSTLAGRCRTTENGGNYPARTGTVPDKRLGTTQQAYEKAFAGVVNRILDEGYQVIALSTCTGIDSYNKDDAWWRSICASTSAILPVTT